MPFLLPCSKKSQIVSLFFSGMLDVEGFLCTPLLTFWGCGLLIWPFPPAGLLFMRLLFKCFWGWTIDVWLLLFTLSWALFKAPLAAADSRASLKNLFLSCEHNLVYCLQYLIFALIAAFLASFSASVLSSFFTIVDWTSLNQRKYRHNNYIPHLDEEFIILCSNIFGIWDSHPESKATLSSPCFPSACACCLFSIWAVCFLSWSSGDSITLCWWVLYCCCNSSQQSRSKAKSRNEKRL